MIASTTKRCGFLGPIALPIALVVAFQGCRIVAYDVRLTSLSITPPTVSVAAGTTQQFTASGTYNDDSARDVTAEAAWTSSDPTIATVDPSGVATPAKPGTTTITATLGGRSASSALTVTNALLQSIEVTPADASIPNGTTLQLAATGHFDDGTTQDLTAQATWTSSDASVTVSDEAGSKGLASSAALGPATATLTATFGASADSATLTVRDVSLTSLSVTPASATIPVGRTQPFAATGTFSDASTHVMTGEVTWQSSDPSIATIGSAGRATGVFAGTTTITATSSALLGSVPGSAQLVVQTASPGY